VLEAGEHALSGGDKRTKPAAKEHVPICAIGASAGGIGALQSLFRQLPTDLGLAYVVILHLSPGLCQTKCTSG
jgi:chemotaxis response regulator CheB